jgi:uncharacterized protein (TIGR03437 family)
MQWWYLPALQRPNSPCGGLYRIPTARCILPPAPLGMRRPPQYRYWAQVPDIVTLKVSSSSADVQVPAAITTRPMQSSLTFQSYTLAGAEQQPAVVEVGFGHNRAQDTVMTLPGSGPALTLPGTQLGKPGAPVDFTVSARDSSGAVSLSAAKLPAGAGLDAASGKFHWIPGVSQVGNHEVSFTAVNALQVSATGVVRITVGTGKPVAMGLVNGASADPKLGCSPGGMASLLGSWLVQDNSTWTDPTGQSRQLGGTQVQVNGDPVPVLFASGTRVDWLCPEVAPGAPLQVVLATGAGRTEAVSAAMEETAPGILSVDGSGQGQGLIVFPGTSVVAMIRNPQVTGEPAQPGDTLAMRVTGVSPDAQLSLTVGGIHTPVQSIQEAAGSAGLLEVLFTVPAGVPFGDEVPVRIQVVKAGGQVIGSNVVTMAVEAVRE